MRNLKAVVLAVMVGFLSARTSRAQAGDGAAPVQPWSGTGTINLIDSGVTFGANSGNALTIAPGNVLNVDFTPRQVKAAYMGVYVADADATLRAQLKLPEGVGLTVMGVDESGPSKGIVQEHDVLYKLGDQLLVNPEQLEVLVRTHKAGESVEVTVIREAQQIKGTIALVEKELPELPYVISNARRTFPSWPQAVYRGQIQIPPGGTLLPPGGATAPAGGGKANNAQP